MPGLEIDLNQNPSESDLENPIAWDEIEEWDGPANELDYAMVWNDENQGHGQGSDGEQDDAPADGEQDDAPAVQPSSLHRRR
ncbi:unnamed protein product [Miscanthus lutarioriparius]|uniref:Uncharacterized protein n=1 Tax=Miscanthus lutarioriparius TaxID=422564 RepID=A0A811S986_9POAL|nr:unnamed protein product [Miscanthus lutarioriparius]